MAIALLVLAEPAFADGPGLVTQLHSGGGSGSLDNRPCAFFQTNDGPGWYSIPKFEADYKTDFDTLLSARLSVVFGQGASIDFQTGPTVPACGYPQASGIHF